MHIREEQSWEMWPLMRSELNLTHTNGTLGHNCSYETTSSILSNGQKQSIC